MTGAGEARSRQRGRDGQLSVVVPCRDAGSFLGEAVRSVLEQRGRVPDLEVLIVDDHSTDPETVETIARLEDRPRVRVVKHLGASRPAAARNTGIAEARGRWLGFVDADDVWLPDGLAARWDVVGRHPDARFVSADFTYLHPDGTRKEEGFFATRPVPRRVFADALRTETVQRVARPVREFLRAVCVWTGVVLVRRELVEELGGFDERLWGGEDDHLWIRIARRADLYFVPEIVTLKRLHDSSMTAAERPPGRWGVQAYELLLDEPEFQDHRPQIHEALCRFHLADARYHRSRREPLRAVRSAVRALRRRPLCGTAWRTLIAGAVGRP